MTMNDSQKFVDMLHNVPWEDGLNDDVLRGMIIAIKTTCNFELFFRMCKVKLLVLCTLSVMMRAMFTLFLIFY